MARLYSNDLPISKPRALPRALLPLVRAHLTFFLMAGVMLSRNAEFIPPDRQSSSKSGILVQRGVSS
jgi:hypothetical protein